MAESLSLREQLQAAHDELSAEPIDTTATLVSETAPPAAEPVEPVAAAAPEPVGGKTSPADPQAQAAHDELRPRGPDGKFLPKTDTPAAEGAQAAAPQAAPETATPAQSGPQTPETTAIPPALSAAVKAQWSGLPQAVRDEFSRLEGTFAKGKAEWEGKGQRLNRFEEIISPHLPRWEMNGLDAFTGIQSLIAAQSLLDRNPVDGLVQIARSYGLTPAHLAQAFGLSQANGQQPGPEGQMAPTGNPDIQAVLQSALTPVMTQVQTLQQQIAQERQASQAAQLAEAQRQVEAFASDPKNMYFHNVQDAVADLISLARQAGQDLSLQDAYDRAVWADPTIRPHLMKAQADAAAAESARAADDAKKAAEAAQRAKAQSAQRAAGSVTGSPAPGSAPSAASQGSVRESLMAAMQEHSGV